MNSFSNDYEAFFESWMMKLFNDSNDLEEQKNYKAVTLDNVNNFIRPNKTEALIFKTLGYPII